MARSSAATVLAPTVPTPTAWRPPGWIFGDSKKPYTPEDREVDGVVVKGVVSLYKRFDELDYYTRGGSLSELAEGAKDENVAREVLHNVKLLRDAWNTAGSVWRFVRQWFDQPFRVDPFWNEGARELPDLVRMLNGLTPETDGLAADVNGFPLNWRGDLPKGEAAAAVNGPHSITEKWLRLCAAYGQEEIVAAFVPDAADRWWYEIGLTSSLVFRFGRVSCHAPPGIKSSSPRETSAVLLWIPQSYDQKRLPEHTQKAIKGKTFVAAYDTKPGKDKRPRDLLVHVHSAHAKAKDFGFGVKKGE